MSPFSTKFLITDMPKSANADSYSAEEAYHDLGGTFICKFGEDGCFFSVKCGFD